MKKFISLLLLILILATFANAQPTETFFVATNLDAEEEWNRYNRRFNLLVSRLDGIIFPQTHEEILKEDNDKLSTHVSTYPYLGKRLDEEIVVYNPTWTQSKYAQDKGLKCYPESSCSCFYACVEPHPIVRELALILFERGDDRITIGELEAQLKTNRTYSKNIRE
ncbi:MAG: hypothetical protein LBD17_03560 [Endomicrobium sp.]|jgi:hypothetical protein|nr:hypothetical protein [Endomicrobium sp.]